LRRDSRFPDLQVGDVHSVSQEVAIRRQRRIEAKRPQIRAMLDRLA
jgi:hypothetical protein